MGPKVPWVSSCLSRTQLLSLPGFCIHYLFAVAEGHGRVGRLCYVQRLIARHCLPLLLIFLWRFVILDRRPRREKVRQLQHRLAQIIDGAREHLSSRGRVRRCCGGNVRCRQRQEDRSVGQRNQCSPRPFAGQPGLPGRQSCAAHPLGQLHAVKLLRNLFVLTAMGRLQHLLQLRHRYAFRLGRMIVIDRFVVVAGVGAGSQLRLPTTTFKS